MQIWDFDELRRQVFDWRHLVDVCIGFVFLALVFRPLELAFPAKPNQKFIRPAWWTDLIFFLGQYLLWNAVVFWLLVRFGMYLDMFVSKHFREAVASQPWWLMAIEIVLLSDFFIYWGHRLQHNNAFLWRFHSIHHTAEHMDWLAAHREHPLDTIYTVTLINLPAFMVGFPLKMIVGFIAFRGIWAIYIHSNVRLPIPYLRWFIGAPELHHWHHDKDRRAGNYANISPLMDLMFGTYKCPDHEPESFGISEPIAKNYVGHMLWPFWKPEALMKEDRPPAEEGGGFEVIPAEQPQGTANMPTIQLSNNSPIMTENPGQTS